MTAPCSPIWLSAPTRFAGQGRQRARLWLAAIVLLLLASVACTLAAAPPPAIDPTPHDYAEDRRDIVLYARIVAEVRGGADYYQATATALRQGNYPLRPFVTFRLPTLARVLAVLPPMSAVALQYVLVAAVVLAWAMRLRAAFKPGAGFAIFLALTIAGLGVDMQVELLPFHEIWAALLIALSLALWDPRHWLTAVAVGTAAMLIREIAALYVLVMAALALIEGRRRELIGWGLGLCVLAAVVVLHAQAVARVVTPLDPASPGWAGMLGPGFFVRAILLATPLTLVPASIGAPLATIALIGWGARPDPTARRVLAVVIAYALLISMAARADTFYWVLLISPLLIPGLAFVPDTARDLIKAARSRQERITASRAMR